MTTLYVVERFNYDDYSRFGIYDDRDIAQKIADLFDGSVSEVELNQGAEFLTQGIYCWTVDFQPGLQRGLDVRIEMKPYGDDVPSFVESSPSFGTAWVIAATKQDAVKEGRRLRSEFLKGKESPNG